MGTRVSLLLVLNSRIWDNPCRSFAARTPLDWCGSQR